MRGMEAAEVITVLEYLRERGDRRMTGMDNARVDCMDRSKNSMTLVKHNGEWCGKAN